MSEPPYAPFRLDVSGMSETMAFPDTPIERLRAGALSLRQTTSLARALARSGRAIDLTGLDGQIGLLCAKALDLDPEEGRLIAAELDALLTEVDLLAEAMRLSIASP
jgi:hypothetical protein